MWEVKPKKVADFTVCFGRLKNFLLSFIVHAEYRVGYSLFLYSVELIVSHSSYAYPATLQGIFLLVVITQYRSVAACTLKLCLV